MLFNENWTKEDNDLHRKLIKEGKSTKDIISIMKMDKLKYHTKNKYISFSKL